MSRESNTLHYGKKKINYRLLYSKRKTLEIAVHPDGSVVIKAPLDSSREAVEEKLCKRIRWVNRQLDYFEQFSPRTPTKSYVGGETHLYNGKQYRLKLLKESPSGVRLIKGFFLVSCGSNCEPAVVKKLMDGWYLEKAIGQFNDRFYKCWSLVKNSGIFRPSFGVKPMKRRWGSLSKKGVITLNPELIKAPGECIDYVIIHELCHLKHPYHSPEFYALLEKILPDWERRKHKLEIIMA